MDVNFSINESNLILKYKEVFTPTKQEGRTMTYYHTCIFNLHQATIYSGFWSNSYLGGKIGVCCHSGLAERNAEYHVNSIFYRS